MVNEERVFMGYAIKVSKDTPVTVFTLTITPFLIASLGLFLIMIILPQSYIIKFHSLQVRKCIFPD
jgi:hypothetical protein